MCVCVCVGVGGWCMLGACDGVVRSVCNGIALVHTTGNLLHLFA